MDEYYFVTYPHRWGAGKIHRMECRYATGDKFVGYRCHAGDLPAVNENIQLCRVCRPILAVRAG